MVDDYGVADGESQTLPFSASHGFGAEIGVEYLVELFAGDTPPGVTEGNMNVPSRLKLLICSLGDGAGLGSDAQGAPLRHGLPCVKSQMIENMLDLILVQGQRR